MAARVSPNGGYSEESQRHSNAEFVAEQRKLIEAWCVEHIGQVLPITHEKDFNMVELWDDRAVQIIHNTGVQADEQRFAEGKEAGAREERLRLYRWLNAPGNEVGLVHQD